MSITVLLPENLYSAPLRALLEPLLPPGSVIRRPEDGMENLENRRLLFAVAQKILPCSAAKGKLQRINNHGFAGTRFARQNIQPISKGDFAFLNQRHISDVQMFQHKASPL